MSSTPPSLDLITSAVDRLRTRLSEIIVGQEQVIEFILVALLARGHVLLEGVPGLAKTMLIKTLAALLDLDFARVQLTPDMLPADIVGTNIYDLNTRTFALKKGPVFTSLLLADEINRTPPKTQSALLEAMEERQVTLDRQSYKLPDVFMVVATQNSIEFEGTYPLPEAQLDRFMLKVKITYPDKEAERLMLQNWQAGKYDAVATESDSNGEGSDDKSGQASYLTVLKPVVSAREILDCQNSLSLVKVEESVLNYLLELITKSRTMPDLQLGGSPRAALHWLAAARAHAALSAQDYVTPDNIKHVAEAILSHRLVLTPEAELEGLTAEQMTANLLKQIPVPR
jgi:MoxR-like ATPase